MLYSSLVYTGNGSLVGVGVLLAGIPVLVWQKKKNKNRNDYGSTKKEI
jgi:hypothetical protein